MDFSYPGAEDVSLASLEAVARLDDTPRTSVLHDVSFRRGAGHDDGARGSERRGQDDDLDAGLASLRRRRRLGDDQRRRPARGDDGVTQRDRWRRHPGRAPLPRHPAGEPPLRQARRDRRRRSTSALGGRPDRRPRGVAAPRALNRRGGARVSALGRREAARRARAAAA